MDLKQFQFNAFTDGKLPDELRNNMTALELALVAHYPSDKNSQGACEQVTQATDIEQAISAGAKFSFTVYGYVPEEGAHCLHDFKDYVDAITLVAEINSDFALFGNVQHACDDRVPAHLDSYQLTMID